MKIKSVLTLIIAIFTVLSMLTSCGESSVGLDTADILEARAGEAPSQSVSEVESEIEQPPHVLTADEELIAEKALKYISSIDYQGAVLLGVNGNIVFEGAYGYADKDAKENNRVGTVFQIASLTKQFTAAAIMKLQEEKKLNVNDKLSKYFPDFKHADSITIDNLMSMTSGLKDFADSNILDACSASSEYPFGHFFEEIKDYGLSYTPGSYYTYCNSNYYILGMIISKVSKMTYEEYMQENIFKPLKMENTGFDTSKVTAKSYSWGNLNTVIYDKSVFYASGAICSTVEDMFKWLNGFNDGRIVNKESLKYIRSNHTGLGYSCGWSVGESGNQHHSGNLSAFRGYDMISYDNNVMVVILSNNEQTEVAYIGQRLVGIANDVLDSVKQGE